MGYTKPKSKGTAKSKVSAQRYYQAKMASRQADALKRGTARVNKAAQEEKAKVEKDIREAFEAEKEMLRRAAERMAQAEKEQQEEWFRATRASREAPKAKSEGSKSQRKTTTAQKQARGTKQQQKRKETPKPAAAKPKKATNKDRAAQKKKEEEEAFRESRQSRATKSSKEKRTEKFEARRRKPEVEVMDEDSDGELELTDVEDPVAAQLASIGIDYSKLTLDQLKRIAPLSTLLDKMSPDQIKEALSFSTFSPDGRPIIRTNVVKSREIPRNTHRFVLDDKGNRIYIG